MLITSIHCIRYIAALFVPLVVAGLVTRFLLNVESYGLQCEGFASNDLYQGLGVENVIPNVFSGLAFGPPSEITADELWQLVPCQEAYCRNNNRTFSSSSGHVATSLDDFNTQVTDQLGGFYIDSSGPPLLAFLAESNNAEPLRVLGTLDQVLTQTSVKISYGVFSDPYTPRDFFQSLVGVFTCLGFILFPGLFALYPTRERLQKVREMHYSNGILSGPLWTAYALFDFCFLLLIAILSTVIWLATDYNWYNLGYMFVV